MRVSLSGRRRGARGLTLLELAVAIAVLALGSIAALRATDQARLELGGALPRLLAQQVAENHAQAMALMGWPAATGLPKRATMAGREFTLTVETHPTAGGLVRATITARTEQGPGARRVTWIAPGPPP